MAGRGGDYLRQRNQAFKSFAVRLDKALGPVGQLLHPMLHPDGDFFAADRTSASISVSYTHLDVYKRKGYYRTSFVPAGVFDSGIRRTWRFV